LKTIQTFVGNWSGIWLGYAAGIGAAIAYGAAQTVGKHVTSEYAPPLVGTAFSLLFGFVYVSIMFHRHIPNDLRTSSRRGFLWFGLSGIASAAGVTLLYFALSNAPLVVVSPVVAINPLITLTLAHLFLHKLEKISRRTIVGTVMVVLGVVIITASKAVS
jgi:drug/metabolite transporter (DMT)-like permease